MDERLIPTRDIFLSQAAVIIVFVTAEHIAYAAHKMGLGILILLGAAGLSALFGQKLLARRLGALNAYSIAMLLGAFIYWVKWWVLT
jgi:hypothetical protein